MASQYIPISVHDGATPKSSPRTSLLGWRPTAAWLPVAALFGALLTLAMVSLGGSSTGVRWKGEWAGAAAAGALVTPPPAAAARQRQRLALPAP